MSTACFQLGGRPVGHKVAAVRRRQEDAGFGDAGDGFSPRAAVFPVHGESEIVASIAVDVAAHVFAADASVLVELAAEYFFIGDFVGTIGLAGECCQLSQVPA